MALQMERSPEKYLSEKITKKFMKTIDLSCDGHVHTHLCHHATGDMEEYVVAGIEKGLSCLIFLEHFEIGISYFESTWLTEEDFSFYFEEGKRLAEKYRDKIIVKTGVEVGYNPDFVNQTVHFLKKYSWARIALSYHYLRTDNDHVNMVSRRHDNLEAMAEIGINQVATAYYSGLLEAIEIIPASVICHLDAVLRHYPGMTFSSQHIKLIDRLLERMKEKNMALEINTSGFSHRNEPYPSFSFISKAQKMGIELVAGSDAHCPENVGRYFDRLAAFFKQANPSSVKLPMV